MNQNIKYRVSGCEKPGHNYKNSPPPFFLNRLKADKELVKDVYSAAKKLKMDRVKQVAYYTLWK